MCPAKENEGKRAIRHRVLSTTTKTREEDVKVFNQMTMMLIVEESGSESENDAKE